MHPACFFFGCVPVFSLKNVYIFYFIAVNSRRRPYGVAVRGRPSSLSMWLPAPSKTQYVWFSCASLPMHHLIQPPGCVRVAGGARGPMVFDHAIFLTGSDGERSVEESPKGSVVGVDRVRAQVEALLFAFLGVCGIYLVHGFLRLSSVGEL